ncbi:class I SAM-dependent methyltransferase [Dyadobacter sandarakinus]|uniref:Class I SAM-dependent methyltransferase n=1 Tax=Dyadobacter sandarakinus TaxID=2747268 RepID=A0ABX7IBD7_9BACT|nr:class I SAM-dependent methyltransferase [Dyadobacter sandarakinus]QRR02842.1 class I SAM-dependent methyltransferase [Dyadobacter sandarakinus]
MSLETLENCPVCGHTNFENHLLVEDYTVSHEQFHICRCSSCSFLFTNPRPREASIGGYYASQDYISHHDDRKDLMSSVYTSVRNYTLRQKVGMINDLAKRRGSLLDIGCGTGAFLNAAKDDGWKISGTEPDPDARGIASGRVGAPVFENIQAAEIQQKSFDIISLWHVLEHVHQLNETIKWIGTHLNPGGKVIIAVPNPESADARKYGPQWAAYDVPRHLYHFTKASMQNLLGRHGLQVAEVRPMWFDSFYVSMLSTKYKSGKVRLAESFISGAISNIRGTKPSVNTSSLIYVVSKK